MSRLFLMSNAKVQGQFQAPLADPAPDAVDHIVAQWQREMPGLESDNMILFGRLKRCTALLQARDERGVHDQSAFQKSANTWTDRK